jgi:hypothetical protein
MIVSWSKKWHQGKASTVVGVGEMYELLALADLIPSL